MEFKLNSEQFQAALRAVLAGLIVFIVAQTLRLENSNWSLLTVLILIQPRARATYQKGIYRIIGTFMGAGFAVLLIGLFAQEPLFLLIFLAAGLFPIFYLMSGKLLPYSFLMGGFTLIMVLSPGLQDPSTSMITAVFRTMEIVLGVVASVFVTLWLWPQSAQSSFRKSLRDLAILLRTVLARRFQIEGTGKSVPIDKVRAEILAALDQLSVLADQVVLEGSLTVEEQQALTRTCHEWEALALGVLEWADTPVELLVPRVQSGEREELEKFAKELDQVLSDVESDPEYSPVEARGRMRISSEKLLLQLVEQRNAGWSKNFKVEENFSYYRVLEAVRNIAGALEHISLPPLRSDTTSHLGKDLPVWSRLPAEVWADLKNPEPARLKLAIKITLLFIFLLLASQASHLSFMLQSMISALLVLSQSNVGSTVHKAIMRLAGAVAGGLLALAILSLFSPFLNSLAFLLVITAGVMFVSSYVSNGPPSYNYLGVQGGLAFFLTMFSGFSPPLTVDPAISRFAGVLVGSLMAILLTTSVMPTHAGSELAGHLDRLREHLAKAFRRIRQGQGEAGNALAGAELKQCKLELTASSNFLLHSRIEGVIEPEHCRAGVKDLEQLRKIYLLLQDLNEIPTVLHKLPPDHSLTQTLEQAMNAIETRLLDPAGAEAMEAKRLSEAILRARREGTLTKWDAADVTAAGASMYLLGQLLSIQSPAAELGPGFVAEPLV